MGEWIGGAWRRRLGDGKGLNEQGADSHTYIILHVAPQMRRACAPTVNAIQRL